MSVSIVPYAPTYRAAIFDLSLKAWAPVFEKLKPAVQDYVYANFYPKGWEVRQTEDIGTFLDDEGEQVWVALDIEAVTGFVGIRLHPEDKMGEIYILAVDPDHQRKGIAQALIEIAFEHLRHAGMKMVMVETGDDPGHAPSRATYEAAGFARWPVARYFRKL
jgi:GNAT superfamily N-acetyltransferase